MKDVLPVIALVIVIIFFVWASLHMGGDKLPY